MMTQPVNAMYDSKKRTKKRLFQRQKTKTMTDVEVNMIQNSALHMETIAENV